jgi:release factor glutamine methyltransferase
MMPSETIAEVLRRAVHALAQHSESPRLDAEVLLGKVLGVTRSALIVRGPEPIAADALHQYQGLIERRATGTPVAYLTGRREFWSLQLDVTPAVLVPRPETETLVELALRLLPLDREPSVLDLGTGSGAIALAIAAERPRARVTGIDISPAALGVARRNASALGLPRVEWRLGSWFEPVAGERFDLIVANPPYVADTDPALAKLADEPPLALRSGPTGLESLEAIIEQAAAHGWVLLEHGSSQGPEVARLLEQRGFTAIRSHDDYSGRPRVTAGNHSFATLGNLMIRFETTLGDFTIELFDKKAPETVQNFLKYIDSGFFDGTIFHRIVPGFVIQGGGFTEDMTQKSTQPPIKNEADNGLKNERGTLSMARTNDINSATSQFFVNLKDNDFLDHKRGNFGYAVFARVTEGMDVIDKIAAVETARRRGFDDVPVEAVVMKRVRRFS